MTPVSLIPNEPELLVLVTFDRHVPSKRRAIVERCSYVGASARLGSAELGEEARQSLPVQWRFIRGFFSGDDVPNPGSQWNEKVIEIDGAKTNAREWLEKEMNVGNESNFRWFLLEPRSCEVVR